MLQSQKTRIQTLVDEYIGAGAVGVCLAISTEGASPIETICAGMPDRHGQSRVTSDTLFKIGSCTKTFVAAALVKLAEEKALDLGSPIAPWFPDLPQADRISLRQLVNHRNGLPEYEHDLPMEPDREWSPAQLVTLAFTNHTQTEPGASAVYNNTGYVLAGMLIEQITGMSLAQYVRQAILGPLGLRDTWTPTAESFPKHRLARGYYARRQPVPEPETEMWRMEGVLPFSPELQDTTDIMTFSGAYACGDMVSTARDMATFLRALLTGRVVGEPLLAELYGMRVPMSYPNSFIRETGAGLFLSDYEGHLLYGHRGSIPGYTANMQHDVESGLTIAATCNVGSGNRSAFEAAGVHDLVRACVKLLL